MLLNIQDCEVLMIDMQEKLLPEIYEHLKLVDHCAWIIALANALGVPILVSEQYPKGLGRTDAKLTTLLTETTIHSKQTFSYCADATGLKSLKDSYKKQIILIGIEAHVCILQTAVELLSLKKQVYVVADAVSSRSLEDKEYALQRMRAYGVHIITREMVLFEWLRTAADPRFKELNKKFLQDK